MDSQWIKHPVLLLGRNIELRPLDFASLDALFSLSQDPRIWTHTSINYSLKDNFYPSFDAALKGRESGVVYPFLICDANRSRIIGTTRLLEVVPKDRNVEIGVTWLASQYWGTGANTEAKYLLLKYCFESLNANCVQFRAKSENIRSRRALEKLGATFEGVFRKDKIEPGGRARNTAFYSIVDDDWPGVKLRLELMLTDAGSG